MQNIGAVLGVLHSRDCDIMCLPFRPQTFALEIPQLNYAIAAATRKIEAARVKLHRC